jgi:ketosteroid isomerase-like protein
VSAWPDRIAQLEERRRTAMTAPDPESLTALLSDDVVYTHSDGSVDDKDAYLASVRTGDLVYRRVDQGIERILTRDGTAVVFGTMAADIVRHGAEKTLDNRTVVVYTAEPDGEYRLIAFQSTPIRR